MSISAALALAKKYSNGGAVETHPPMRIKKHINFQGLQISIETPKGEIRRGIDHEGKPWANRMSDDYGYIKRTEGKDGDQVDVFVGPNKRSNKVFIIDQLHHHAEKFDEHKCLLGYNDRKQALTAYHKSYGRKYGSHHTVGAVTEMSIDAFKEWLKGGGGKKPISPEVPQYQTGGAVYDPIEDVPGVGPVPTTFPDVPEPAAVRAYREAPSWLEQAQQDAARSAEAYQQSGVRGLMADTSIGQELAGGFAGSTTGRVGKLAKYGTNPWEHAPDVGTYHYGGDGYGYRFEGGNPTLESSWSRYKNPVAKPTIKRWQSGEFPVPGHGFGDPDEAMLPWKAYAIGEAKLRKDYESGWGKFEDPAWAPRPRKRQTGGVVDSLSKVGSALYEGAKDWASYPGEVMKQETPELPQTGEWTEEDEYRRQAAMAAQQEQAAHWGGESALNLYGTSAPFRMPRRAPTPAPAAVEPETVDVGRRQVLGGLGAAAAAAAMPKALMKAFPEGAAETLPKFASKAQLRAWQLTQPAQRMTLNEYLHTAASHMGDKFDSHWAIERLYNSKKGNFKDIFHEYPAGYEVPGDRMSIYRGGPSTELRTDRFIPLDAVKDTLEGLKNPKEWEKFNPEYKDSVYYEGGKQNWRQNIEDFLQEHQEYPHTLHEFQAGGAVKYTEPTPEDPTRYPYYESEPGPGDAPPQPIAPQPEQPPVMDVTGVGPVPTSVPETVKAIGAGLLEYGETPGELMKGPEQVEPRVEGQWDETDEYRQQLANAMWHKKVTDFAGETGINLFGTSAPFVQPGTLGVAGGKLFKEAQPKKYEFKGDPFKATPTPVEGFVLHPAEVKASKQITGTLGTSEGGTFTGFSDGINRYIKEAKSLDHAREEVLASKLYELAGVPVAKMQVTALKGKPAISSHIISGAQQLSEFQPHQYSYIKGIQEHHAADAWLANWDWGGFGPENYLGNILVDAQGNAHRIDFGGALSRRGLGASKGDLFTDTVGELQTLKQKQPSLLKDVTLDPSNPTANRIADITDKQISDLVYQSKITNPEKMIKKLIARRDDLAKQYGIGKPEKPHIVGGTDFTPQDEEALKQVAKEQGLDAPEGGRYSYDDLKLDAGKLLTKHQYGDGTFDAEGIANDIYSMALKDPEYADGVAEKLKKSTPTLHDAVQESLSQIIKKEGDPWAKQAPASPAIKLMQLNKTHSLDQIVNTVKNYDSQEVEMGKMITQKQSDKITQMIDSYPLDKIYGLLKNLSDEQKINLKSWLSPKTEKGIVNLVENLEKPKNIPSIENVNASHSLEQIVHAIKNYDKTQIEVPYEVYDSVPKILDGYSAQAIVKATKNLSLGEQTKFDKWLTPQQLEVVDNFKHSQSLQASNVHFIEKRYYDALEDGMFNWSTYKPKKSTSDLMLTMDPKLLAKAQKLGFNPYADVWKGGKKYPTLSGYPEEIFDPATKDPSKYTYAGERGWFAAPREMGAAEYGTPSLYIARAPKATMVEWPEITGGDHSYFGNSIHLKRLINAGHEKGLDLIVVKNIHDVEGFGDQYVFLNTAVLRAPNAAFDPKKLKLRKPLAGLAGGGIFAYGTLRGQEGEKFARGGSIKSTKDESNYRLGTRKENCAICTMFRPPDSCTAVQGKIRPQDTCDYFELSKRKNPMPLKKGSSQSTISSNIREFHTGDTYAKTKAKFGKAKADKQAIAVAMSTARKYGKKQKGGGVDMEKMLTIGASRGLQREGMINSAIPGRTDKLPMNVKAGSYVLPADIPSALGQGNTAAGGEILNNMFSSGPYGMKPMRGGKRPGYPSMRMARPRVRPFKQEGGEIEEPETQPEDDSHVPIIAAGGEYIIDPEVVKDIGHGNIKAGHSVLDKFVLRVRKHHIDTLKKLKPPKK